MTEILTLLPYSEETMPSRRTAAQRRNTQRKSQPQSTPKKLKVLSSKTVYDGRVFRITSDKVQEPTGVVAQRDVVRHSGSIVILPVEESGPEPRVLLISQYRYAADAFLWELPAGRLESGEQPLAGAKRELREETGYSARQWKKALFFYPSPGFLDETMTIFLARDLTVGEAQPEEDESIECKLMPLSQAVELVMAGKIPDGKAIAGILWCAEFLRREDRGQG